MHPYGITNKPPGSNQQAEENMFGVLISKSKNGKNKNIGDFIQAIAAKQFIEEKYITIDRELLSDYVGEPVKLIMNGWYMHHPEKWPPSKDILPLLISVHISPSVAKEMLTNEGVNFLKKHQPIGCRDKSTLGLLKQNNIEAYFSSCLTTTLGQTYRNTGPERNPEVYFVDPFFRKYTKKQPLKFASSILLLLTKLSIIKKINSACHFGKGLVGLVRTAQFYKMYSTVFSDAILTSGQYITHMVDIKKHPNTDLMFERADKLLKEYSKCSLVVTSRIHAALPCLGMETPTIFVDDEWFNNAQNSERGRFDGLLELLNVIEWRGDAFHSKHNLKLQSKITNARSIKNPDAFRKHEASLVDACNYFVK